MADPDVFYDVIIATPGFSFHQGYVRSLVDTCRELSRRGITYKFVNRASSSVNTARELTALDSDGLDFNNWAGVCGLRKNQYGKIFWVDSDIEWSVSDFMALLENALDIVSGLYVLDTVGSVACTLNNKDGLPVRINKSEFILRNDCVKVVGVGFGFLAVRSGVFESMDREWFRAGVLQVGSVKANTGEDYAWCARAREAGFDIYIDTTVRLIHHKSTTYTV
jgi:hypothetical protein